MSYVIYHKETTYYMPGMKRGGYGSKGAATAALNKTAKKMNRRAMLAGEYEKTLEAINAKHYDSKNFFKAWAETAKKFGTDEAELRDATNGRAPRLNKDDYAIADDLKFHNEIEKMVTRVNLMSKKEYQERANTPISCSPAFETYWSM